MTDLRRLDRSVQPRTLRTKAEIEPRLSIEDEQQIVDAAHRRNQPRVTADLHERLSRMYADLQFIEAHIGQVAAGNHRDTVRFTRRGIDNLAKKLH